MLEGSKELSNQNCRGAGQAEDHFAVLAEGLSPKLAAS